MTPAATPTIRGGFGARLAPGLADHQQRRGPTLRVLRDLHDLIRMAAVKDTVLTRRCGDIQRKGDSSELLTAWLRLHLDSSPPLELVSDGLLRWLQENNAGLVRAGSGVERRHLLEHCLRNWSGSGTGSPEETLIAAGLGLVLIRYSPVLRESYYHWLLCDLLPDAVCCNMMNTLTVPEGHGMIGWVMELSRVRAQQNPALLSRPMPVAIPSCFLDPRGRVATEDLIVGNRSWIGLPLFDTEGWGDVDGAKQRPTPHPLGVLFCFLPLDGLFCFEVGSPVKKVNKTVPFVRQFQKIVLSHRRELLLALNWESAASENRQSIGGEPQGKQGEHPTIDWIGRALLSDRVEPDEPLGFLTLLATEKVKDEESNNVVRMREQTFVNRVFEMLQLGSLYPRGWAPTSATILDRLRAEAERTTGSDLLLIWHRYGGGDESLRRFYSPGAFDQGQLAAVARKLDLAISEHMSLESERTRTESQLTKKLREALILHSGGERVLDLLLPVTEVDGGVRRCRGLVRIKCRRPAGGDAGEDFEPFCCLHRTIREHCQQWVESFARFLGSLETQIGKPKLLLGDWKLYCDLRTVFCDAVTWRLTQVFHAPRDRVPNELGRMNLAEMATKLADADLALNMGKCQNHLETFCQILEAVAATSDLPDVILVSVWLTANRFAITKESASHDVLPLDVVLTEDYGLRDLLRALIDRYDGVPMASFEHLRGYHPVSQSGRDVPAIRPPAFVRQPGTDPHASLTDDSLSYQVRGGAGDEPVTLTLRSRGRNWKTTWNRTQFPDPAAVHFVPGAIERNLFSDIVRPGVFDVRDGGTSVPAGDVLSVSLAEVLQAGPSLAGSSADILSRVENVVNVLSPSPGANAWRAVALTAQDHKGLVLAYRAWPESQSLRDRCDAALLEVQRTYGLIHQEAEVQVARKEQERLRDLGHSLMNAFAVSQGIVESKLQLRLGENDPDYQHILGYFNYLNILVKEVVKSERDLVPWTTNVHEMIRLLKQWLNPAYPEVKCEPELDGVSPQASNNRAALSMFMVLGNLIENAFRYAGEPGSVFLTCHSVKDRRAVQLVIENSGIPMRDVCARYLSNPKANPLPSTPNRGLPVVVRYLQQLGLSFPKVEAPAADGTGTKITLTLPLTVESLK